MEHPALSDVQSKVESRLPSAVVVGPGPLVAESANAFLPRYLALIEALRESFDVTFEYVAPAKRPQPRSFSLRLLRRLRLHLDSLPRSCWPVPAALDQKLSSATPDLFVVLSPFYAHLVLTLPPGPPVVCVLEECLERSSDLRMGGVSAFEGRLLQAELLLKSRRLYRKVARRAELVVLIAKEEEERFVSRVGRGRARTAVLPHGIDVERYRPISREKNLDFLVFGNMGSTRNVDGALRVFESVRRAAGDRNLRWAFVGPDPAPALCSLEGPLVQVPGMVDDLSGWVGSASVVLSPSEQVTGVKTTVLQALAMAAPLIVSRASAQGLALEGAAVVADGPDEMAEAALRLLDDEARCLDLSSSGRRLVVRSHNVDRIAREFAGMCRDVVRDSGGGISGRPAVRP